MEEANCIGPARRISTRFSKPFELTSWTSHGHLPANYLEQNELPEPARFGSLFDRLRRGSPPGVVWPAPARFTPAPSRHVSLGRSSSIGLVLSSQLGNAPRGERGPDTSSRHHGWITNAVLSSMPSRSECHTEQYLSRESAMARSTAAGGTSPCRVNSICTDSSRRGGV